MKQEPCKAFGERSLGSGSSMTNDTVCWIDQTTGIAGVYVTQIFPFADNRSLPLFYEFEKAVYQSH